MYKTLDEVKDVVKNCTNCDLCKNRHNTVFAEGNPEANLMFIGEGPGADEDMQGLPFVGKAGKLMNQAFRGLGLKREEVYIANIVKCRPPGNRVPTKEEASKCLEYLNAQISLVNPKIIVLLGNTALKNILGEGYGITSARGKWMEKDGIRYMPTFHPAALLRDDTKKIYFWNDLKLVLKELEKID